MRDMKEQSPNEEPSAPPFNSLQQGTAFKYLGSPYDVLYLGLTVDSRLATIMEQLKTFTQSDIQQSSWRVPGGNVSVADNMSLVSQLKTIELALGSHIFDDRLYLQNIYRVEAERDTIFRLTTLILCGQILQKVTGREIDGTLAEGIRQKILGCTNRTMHASKVSLLIWIVYVGGSSASGNVRTWYIASARIVGGLLNRSWGDVKKILQDHIWTGRLEELYYKFWLDCDKDAV